MKLSIVIAVYQSWEIVRRQLLYFDSLDLPDDIEIIVVDDGSEPPITGKCKNLAILYTHDKRAWTQGLARNAGANVATGEYILMTDIDHILSKEAIMDAYNFTGNKMIFPRNLGILNSKGELDKTEETLAEWGAILGTKRGTYASYHGNTFAIRKTTFFQLGGYNPKHCLYGHHAGSRQGEDCDFNEKWNHWACPQDILPTVGHAIYLFPVGRYNKNNDLNPFGLFHNLSYEATPQPNKV